jgi:aminoglycoside 6'-N-acetyltransferase I
MITQAGREHVKDWLWLREQVYHGVSAAFHQTEIEIFLNDPTRACFIEYAGKQPLGFVEVTHRNIVDGCLSSPVGYVEGICVVPEARGKGVARRLLEHAERWLRERGCSEIATDAEIDNPEAIAFHRAMGFQETFRIVEFRKLL